MTEHTVWRPLDVHGLRLYQVEVSSYLRVRDDEHPTLRSVYVVAAMSLAEAERIVWAACERTDGWRLVLQAYPLNVGQPASWFESEESGEGRAKEPTL